MCFRNLQRDISKALNSSEGNQSYRTVVVLSLESRGELMWWKNCFLSTTGKIFWFQKNRKQFFSENLKGRMGSSFGPLRNRRTLVLGGANPAHKCSRTSSSFSSNKSLATQNRQATCSVCNRQPNCSNIHKQIRWNPLTSTFILSNRTMAFCSENEPNSVSSLCAANKNCIADRKSRVFNDSLEWMLNPQVFQQILLKMHGLEVDLFASRINHQLTAFVSWRPEPGTILSI